MDFVQANDIVVIDYSIKYMTGKVFDSTQKTGPQHIQLGKNRYCTGFENAILGMAIGTNKLVTIKAKDMFGERNNDLLITVPNHHVPAHINKKMGQKVEIDIDDKQTLKARIYELGDDYICLDANKEQAGQDFLVSITLHDILRPET
jgi:FKBP-type peptidyl-prolyl cis-trans isomerase 2